LKATTKCKSCFGPRGSYKSSNSCLISLNEVISILRKAWRGAELLNARGLAANMGKGHHHIAPASFKSKEIALVPSRVKRQVPSCS
jgi:hypothetical protein